MIIMVYFIYDNFIFFLIKRDNFLSIFKKDFQINWKIIIVQKDVTLKELKLATSETDGQ
jgi:hypothetical protein